MSRLPKIKTPISFKPALKCIYCGKEDVKLSKEHIIPYSLDGAWTFPKASCADCARITSKFESSVAREMYLTIRTTENFQTRNPEKRPKGFEVIIEKIDGSQQKVKISASKYPTIYPVLHLPPPGILSGAELSEMNPEMNLDIVGNPEEMNTLAAEYPDIAKITPSTITIRWSDFFRMLAKIAHALTVGHCGTVGYTQFLPPLILGSYPYLSNYVGGRTKTTTTDPQIKKCSDYYEITIDPKGNIIVDIDIMYGRCMYTVVSGHVTDLNAFMMAYLEKNKTGLSEG